MADTTQATPASAPAKKQRGALFYVLATAGAISALLLCCCAMFTLAMVTSPDFQEGFTEGYCEGLAEEGLSYDEDPFGICQNY